MPVPGLRPSARNAPQPHLLSAPSQAAPAEGFGDGACALYFAYVYLVRAVRSRRELIEVARTLGLGQDEEEDWSEDDRDAVRLDIAHSIACDIGAWRSCTMRVCKRARRCFGFPPRCFAHLDDVSTEDFASAYARVRKALAPRLGQA
jgi:hypothetical protein